jgi:hypothetical protein
MSEGPEERMSARRKALLLSVIYYLGATICFSFAYWSRTLRIVQPNEWDYVGDLILFSTGFGFLVLGTTMVWRVARRMKVSLEEGGLSIVRSVGGRLRKETHIGFQDIFYVRYYRDGSIQIHHRVSSWRKREMVEILDDELPHSVFFRELKKRGISVSKSKVL